MSKQVIEDVTAHTNAIGVVTRLNREYTYVADSSDIKGLENRIAQLSNKMDVLSKNIKERMKQLEVLPNEIERIIKESGDGQQQILQNQFKQISEGLAKEKKTAQDIDKALEYNIELAKKQIGETNAVLTLKKTLEYRIEKIERGVAKMEKIETLLFVLVGVLIIVLILITCL